MMATKRELSQSGDLETATKRKLSQSGDLETATKRKLSQSGDLKTATDKRVINDPIHGNIELHPLCSKIIDTPQFQRLRFIKQLGGTYFVYPGAAHNRFEHSIGVCHLAGELVKALTKGKPKALENVEITKVDKRCVEIAALCHDLGHGPFSHLFDGSIIPELRKDKKWEHEQGSVDMLTHMLKENAELSEEFKKAGIEDTDLEFIEELIVGPKASNGGEYKGRPKEKWFLYEIVSNKRNGIDVDKWDYFARDCYMLGIGNNFNYKRCIAFSRVIDVAVVIDVNGEKQEKKEKQICFRDKEAANLYDMFHTRYLLHYRAYQHKTCNIIERMIAEALVLANDYIKFPGVNGKECTMSEAIDDMEAYSLVTDDVLFRILSEKATDKPKLMEAQRIIRRVLRRDLYQFVDDERFPHATFPNKDEVKNNILRFVQSDDIDENLKEEILTDDQTGIFADNIVIDLVKLNYGMKDQNPIDKVNFYNKKNPDVAAPISRDYVSLLLPRCFAEQLVRVYCKEEKHKRSINEVFKAWKKSPEVEKLKKQTASAAE